MKAINYLLIPVIVIYFLTGCETEEKKRAQANKEFFQWLKKNNCSIKAGINKYSYKRYTEKIHQKKVALKGNETKFTAGYSGNQWEIALKTDTVQNRPFARDVWVTFTLKKGTAKQVNTEVDLVFPEWQKENYVLVPAFAYNGNRFEWRRIRYSPKLLHPEDIKKDAPTIISDVPRLSKGKKPSKVQLRTGAASQPAVGYQSSKFNKGFWLLTTSGTGLGDSGFEIEEMRGKDTAEISVMAPVVRERYKYRICDWMYPSDDKGAHFDQGDSVQIHFRVFFFKAPEIQSLYDKYVKIRKDVTDSIKLKDELPFSSAFKVAENKFNRQNFVKEHGYYSVGMRNNFLQDWQIGWTGGMISTFPLLHDGSPKTQKRVIDNFNWLYPDGISPSGFFWDSGEDGTKWYGGDIRKPHTKNWHLVRKSGDGLYYVIRQFKLMKKEDIKIKESWEKGTRGVADAFVKLWQEERQLGQFVHNKTGELMVGGSTSGGIVPAAMVLSYQYYGEQLYLEVAKKIAGHYYKNYVKRGLTTGGPGDALQNPDSESSYALLESFMTLYHETGNKKWLNRAEDMANQFTSWVIGYNYDFPDSSLFGKLNINSAGAVFANTQNKHGAPGICTHSGLALLELYRATGKERYLDLLQEIAHNITQFQAHPKKPIEDLPYGWMSERVSTTDWLEGIGEIVRHTTWAETALMLAYTEIPGLYVRPDQSFHKVIDHIDAKVVKDNQEKYILKLSNPTKMTAKVKVLAENADKIKKSLGELPLYNCKKITLKPGANKEIAFDK